MAFNLVTLDHGNFSGWPFGKIKLKTRHSWNLSTLKKSTIRYIMVGTISIVSCMNITIFKINIVYYLNTVKNSI